MPTAQRQRVDIRGRRAGAADHWLAGDDRARPRSEAIVSSTDLYPTLLEVAGLQPLPRQVLDGVSILPALKQVKWERGPIFCHFPHYVKATGNKPATSVRAGRWKLIRFYADGQDQTDRFELYDLQEDIGETHNLAAERPEHVRKLNSLIDDYLQQTEALAPAPNRHTGSRSAVGPVTGTPRSRPRRARW